VQTRVRGGLVAVKLPESFRGAEKIRRKGKTGPMGGRSKVRGGRHKQNDLRDRVATFRVLRRAASPLEGLTFLGAGGVRGKTGRGGQRNPRKPRAVPFTANRSR